MTGWRMGYMAGPEWLAKGCSKVQGQFTSGTCNFNQHAAIAALGWAQTAEGKAEIQSMSNSYFTRRDKMVEWLAPIKEFKIAKPDGAFYLFPDVSGLYGRTIEGITLNDSDDVAELFLTKAHIACVSGKAFGNPDCLRMSFAASEESLKEAVDRMIKLVNG